MKNKLLLLAAIAPWLTAATPAAFHDYQDYLLGGSPEAMATADVNKDGNPDLVIATAGGTFVLLGRPDGTFGTPIAAQPDFSTSVAIADFDGDGNLDIVSTILTNGTQLNLALGNGNGTFRTPRVLNIACTDCYLAAADFNGDGRMDLAVANTSSLAIYLGTGNGGFLPERPTYPLTYAVAIATSDLNKDGKPDLVVADSGAKTLVVFLATGRGDFTSISYPGGSQPYQVILTDLNGDGLADMVSVDRATTAVLVRLNLGKGVFGSSTINGSGCSPFADCTLDGLAAGDFNKDGKMDIATPGGVLYGNGNGTLQPAVGFSAGTFAAWVASGDFNHDGYSDLAVGNFEGVNVSILFGGLHQLTQPLRMSSGGHPHAIATGDFNKDGRTDFAVASYDNNQAQVFLGNGNGTFTAAPALTATTPGAVLATDLNKDGKLDLVVSGDSGTWIYLGNGDGTFTMKAQYASFTGDCTDYAITQVAESCLVSADFNNDNIPDLASAVWIDGVASFLLGNGDGTFRPGPQTFVVANTPQSMAAGDFNKDGKMDLAVSNYFGTIYVYPGNGDGTFGSPTTLAVSMNGAGLAVGDVNGDGNLDLVLASGTGASYIGVAVWVVSGNGDGTFNKPIALLADQAPNDVVIGDFNGDGLLDIASVNFNTDDVSILINNGNLTFLPETIYGTDVGPAALAAADINGDSKLDLLVVNEYSADVTILVNTTP